MRERVNNNPNSTTEGFAVELYLDPEAEEKVRAFREIIYREGIKPIQGLMNDKPHVSLAVFPKIETRELLALTAEFAATLTSFDFRLGSVGTFPTQDNVLFLSPVPGIKLLEIHAEYHRRLKAAGIDCSRYYIPGQWTPHLTLEFNISNEELCESMHVFKENFVPITGEFTQLGVVGFRPIEYLETFKLMKGN